MDDTRCIYLNVEHRSTSVPTTKDESGTLANAISRQQRGTDKGRNPKQVDTSVATGNPALLRRAWLSEV